MKKEGVLFGVLLLVVLSMFLVSAEFTPGEINNKTNLAYTCLNEQIDTLGCSRVVLADKTFALITTGKCKADFLDGSGNPLACWPTGNCDLKTTAQVILGLDRLNVNTTLAEKWLMSHTKVPEDLNWYLEIDGLKNMTCTVNDGTTTSEFYIGENKKLVGTAKGCFTKTTGDYWLQIKQNCYNKEFVTSCNERFLTTLLFKEKDSDTINVLDYTNTAGTLGETTEKINSICFEKNGVCDYEGSLWATMILDYLEYNITGAFPYLITGIEKNPRLLPESFLYFLTNSQDYKTALLEKQISEEYWQESGDKFYDTALALLPFQYETLTEKTNSANWLLETQPKEGCWDNKNIKNTAFILYSLWPRNINWSEHGTFTNGTIDDDEDCLELGNYCMSKYSCEGNGGNVLASLECLYGANVCCDKPLDVKNCFDEGGSVCSRNQDCEGIKTSVSGLNPGESCCIGECKTSVKPDVENTCETIGEGVCEPYLCETGYKSTLEFECSNGDVCCISEGNPKGPWIWILLILIVLVVLGIVFRDKLSLLFSKLKSKFDKKGPGGSNGRPAFPSDYSRSPQMGPPPQRRIIPREPMPVRHSPPMNMGRPKPGAPKELDEVLKKLKEMSK